MDETYSIIFYKSWFFGLFTRKIKFKEVKGHLFPNDFPTKNIFMLILSDETKRFFNLDLYEGFEVSREWFLLTAKNVEKESRGQVKLEY